VEHARSRLSQITIGSRPLPARTDPPADRSGPPASRPHSSGSASSKSRHPEKRDVALVLAGGNALGAYLGGAYEILHQSGPQPAWIVGASAGAVVGAIILGNPPEDRLPKLRQFWAEATQHTGRSPSEMLKPRQIYNGLHVLLGLAWGRPTIYRHRLPGPWSALPWIPNDVAIFDHEPLRETLERLVDFSRLNASETRLTVGCVDVETGEEVFFDNRHDVIRPEHILASTAILPAFPPVEVEGRLLCDAGYTMNLPLDPVFTTEPEGDLLCIAVDLFSLAAPRPASLDAVLERANDLIFASPPRRAIAALRREYALRQELRPDGPKVTLLHVAYQASADELAAKSFDFSPSSIQDRWEAGRRDMEAGLAFLEERKPDGERFSYLTPQGLKAEPHAEALRKVR
jgi:NTE family protein